MLRLTGLGFDILAVDIDETPLPDEAARAYTARLSREKALAAQQALDHPALIVAADTTVADGDAILGKPADAEEARAMLRQLRGRAHQVYTALTVLDTVTNQLVTDIAVTDVPMRDYSDAEMDAYIASGDPFDKAGGYAIQHTGFHPVHLTSGCFANVVGLPLCHLLRTLREFGIAAAADTPQRCMQHHHYECDVSSQVLEGAASGPNETSAGES